MVKSKKRTNNSSRLRKTKNSRTNPRTFIHKSIYQKQGKYGTGTYANSNIPTGTVIIKETPHTIIGEPNTIEYKFKLIKALLKTNRPQFMDLVPLELPEEHNVIYDDALRAIHQKYFPELDKDTFILYTLKYKRNAFNLNNNPGILFFATKLNHSCNPNVKYYKEGSQMWFETKRPIKADDEIFDSYISTGDTKAERQESLRSRYGFECQCDECA